MSHPVSNLCTAPIPQINITNILHGKMAKTRKNVLGSVEGLEADEYTSAVRTSPRTKTRGRPRADAAKVKKEPAKRGRKKKTPDEPPLMLGNKKSDLAVAASKLSGGKFPSPTPDLSNNSLSNSTMEKTVSIAVSGGASVTENDILAASTPQALMKLINSLVTTQQDAIFDKYRLTSRLQMNHDSLVISGLREELRHKQATIDALQAQIIENGGVNADVSSISVVSSTPRRQGTRELYQSPIRQKSSSLMLQQEDLANELKTIGITLDMQELLTGVRITNYEDDRDKFYFDVKQTSTNIDNDVDAVSVMYRLVIKKKFEQTAEVTYIPSFLREAKNDDARRVSFHLPDYLKDNLIFPYNTLLQFYAKMSKALNKSAKA